MSREIKFRVWDKKQKLMLSIRALQFNKGSFEAIGALADRDLDNEPTFAYTTYEHENMYKHKDIDSGHPFSDIILMQYTGLKDKDGKEIYEGDILKFKPVGEKENIGKVNFLAGMFMVTDKDDYDYEIGLVLADSLKVIGNIYENDLDIISMAKEHSKTMEGLARK